MSVLTELLAQMPKSCPNSTAALLVAAGSSLVDPADLNGKLPAGVTLSSTKWTVAQAVTVAQAIQDPKDFERLAKDTRVTVLRALARNTDCPQHVAIRLARIGYKKGDPELLNGALHFLPVKVLFELRDEAQSTTNVYNYGHLVSVVAERGNSEELLALVADRHAKTAGHALALAVSSEHGAMPFKTAVSYVTAPLGKVLQEAVECADLVDTDFVEALLVNGIDFGGAGYYGGAGVTFTPGALPVLFAALDLKKKSVWGTLARAFRSTVPDQDVERLMDGLRLLLTTANPPVHTIKPMFERFARVYGPQCSQETVDEIVALMPGFVPLAYQASSCLSAVMDDLLMFVSDESRAIVLRTCTISALSAWLRSEQEPSFVKKGLGDGYDKIRPRLGEVGALVAHRVACGDGQALMRSVASYISKDPRTELPWWDELVDALGEHFMQNASNFYEVMGYVAQRLADVCEDNPEMWQLAMSLWPSWLSSFGDLCDFLSITGEVSKPVATPESEVVLPQETVGAVELSLF